MALFGKGKATDPVALLKSGDFKGAIKLLEKKLQQSPGDFTTRLRLAEAHEGAGHREEAAKIYREEGEASLAGGGSRAQGIALLRKAVRLLPEDAALAARLASLEGGAKDASASGSFSFEIDTGEEPIPSGESPPELPAPEIPEAPPAEPTTPGEVPVEIPAEAPAAVVAEESAPEVEVVSDGEETALGSSEAAAPASSAEAMPEECVSEVVAEEPGRASDASGAPQAESTPEMPPGPPPSRLLRPDDPKALMQELFPGLSAQEAAELSATLKRRKLTPGEALIREGELGDSLFLVMEGCLEASSRFQGSNIRLATLQRCDVIGEVAFLKDVPRTATVLAMEPCVVLELSREAVNRRFEDRPDLLGRLESILDERVQKTIQAVKQRWKGD